MNNSVTISLAATTVKNPFESMFSNVVRWAQGRRIRVRVKRLPLDRPCEFDGLSCSFSDEYPPIERLFYVTHALGSIVRWSIDFESAEAMFNRLHRAKADPSRNGLPQALAAYRRFEEESSCFAVWLLAELEHNAAVDAYTNFMRADLEALTIFHSTGEVPIWRSFFNHWNAEALAGKKQVIPFAPRMIPPDFNPVAIEMQRVLQRRETTPGHPPSKRG